MPTILVADDNSNIQKMVSLVFEEKGIRVVAVGNGEAACRKVPEVRPDIVLADVFMPVRNGYEVCEFVKQDSQFANIPVILLVGAFDPLDEKEARRVGADGVLKKPFVPPDPLIAMVTSLLQKNAPPEPEPAPVKEEVHLAPIQQPPPPILPAGVPYVFSETEATPEEFTFGMAPRDIEDADHAAPVFGEPIATPAAKHVEEDDYEEPASEWRRRRSTLEYDIPAEESASMVEKLAGEEIAPDSETLETSVQSKAQVPFAGANVPEKIESISTTAPTKWMDLMGIAKSKPIEPDVVDGHESPVRAEEEPTSSPVSTEPPNGSSNRYAITKKEDAPNYASREAAPQTDVPEPEKASAQQTEWPAPPAQIIPFPAPVESSSAESQTPEQAETAELAVEETQEASPYVIESINPTLTESENTASETHDGVPVEISDSEPAAHPEVPNEIQSEAAETTHAASTKDAPSEAVSAAAAKNAGMDAAAIDSVVAKLLEKLEPQIHEALSNGVLRPLVEEILNRERDKK